jgi:hypothetical protein
MTKTPIPPAVSAIAQRAGLDDDELQALAAYSRELETEHILDRELGHTPEVGNDLAVTGPRPRHVSPAPALVIASDDAAAVGS